MQETFTKHSPPISFSSSFFILLPHKNFCNQNFSTLHQSSRQHFFFFILHSFFFLLQENLQQPSFLQPSQFLLHKTAAPESLTSTIVDKIHNSHQKIRKQPAKLWCNNLISSKFINQAQRERR